MIDTLYLANFIQESLNSNTLGLDFLVFSDEGDLKKSVKNKNVVKEYTQGILKKQSPSSVVPIRNLTYQLVNSELMVIADLQMEGYTQVTELERTQSIHLLNVKQCLYELIKKINGSTLNLEIEGKTYSVTIATNDITVGEKMALGEIAEGIPLYLNITFSIFENGVNTNDCKIVVNGENLYFTDISISRVKQADMNSFAKDKKSKTFVLIGGKSIDLVLPATTSNTSVSIMEDIFFDEKANRAFDVKIETPILKDHFIGILGNTTTTGKLGANLGYNISIVQGAENLLNYDKDVWTKNIVNYNPAVVSQKLMNGGTIYWGDGTYTEVAKGSTQDRFTHQYTDNKKQHTICVYKEI